jgi:hypothetical protein
MDGITLTNNQIVTNVHQDVSLVHKIKFVKLVIHPEYKLLQNVHVQMDKLISMEPVNHVITDVLHVTLIPLIVLHVKMLKTDLKFLSVNVKMNSMMMVIKLIVIPVNQNVLNVLVL